MILTVPDCLSASGAIPLSSTSSSFLHKSLSLFGRFNVKLEKTVTTKRMFRRCKASLITNSDSFEVGRLIGSSGFMNIASYAGLQLGLDGSQDFSRLGVQNLGEGNVKIRLYEGRIAQGPLRGTPVIFKVYPGQQVGGVEADMMAANELNTHLFLQSSSRIGTGNLQILLGGFETKTGEQWLAFRNDGKYSAADYAKVSSDKMSKDRALGGNKYREQSIRRRRYFVIKLLHGTLCGLAYMHDHERLHQSLGPASVVLNTVVEGEAAYLVPRLRDLAFSVDIRASTWKRTSRTNAAQSTKSERIRMPRGKMWEQLPTNVLLIFGRSGKVGRQVLAKVTKYSDEERANDEADVSRYPLLEEGSGTLSEGLWRRASAAGAFTPMEKRAFGIADDIYEAGLLFAYFSFIPFCEAGIMDSLSLQRLLETTFRLDLEATREYCLADDRLLEAVKFLDLGDGAGWELLQAMLNPDFRKRPIAEAVLNHRFMTGSVL